MPVRQSRTVEASRTTRRAVATAVLDIRDARLEAGLSQRTVAAAAGISRSHLTSVEAGMRMASLEVLAQLAAVVGLELSLRVHPAGDALRDAAQLRMLARFVPLVGPAWTRRAEVPVSADPRDRRAFDLVLSAGTGRVAVEAVSRLVAAEAQVRRIMLKAAVGRVDAVVLVLADTRHNRAAARPAAPTLRAAFPIHQRAVLAALRIGRVPPGNGIVFV
jgi:transcriptional regulator with XRE-family HTH domain